MCAWVVQQPSMYNDPWVRAFGGIGVQNGGYIGGGCHSAGIYGQQRSQVPEYSRPVTLSRVANLFSFGRKSDAPKEAEAAKQGATNPPEKTNPEKPPVQAAPTQKPALNLPLQGTKASTQQGSTAKKPFVSAAKTPANTLVDEKGNKYVIIEPWNSAPKEGQKYANDCLSRIICNTYPGVKPYSQEYQKIKAEIMSKNPNIYASGRRNVPAGGTENTLLKDGEKLYL